MRGFYKWFTQGIDPDGRRAPAEVIVIRCFGMAWLALVLLSTISTRPHPGLHGRGAAILVALIALIAAAVASRPQDADLPPWRRIAALVGVTAAAAVLAALQPSGGWQTGAVLVALIAAVRLERVPGALTLAFSVAVLMIVSIIAHHSGGALSVLFTAVPWYLIMRLLHALAVQRNELRESRAAEARAAAAAERGRLAREMHDVLAHSLSALALQLESTRLLARDRGVDEAVTRGLDQAHHLAVSGLQEARHAIATARGDELPGPERIGVLADAFEEQSGLPVAVDVQGLPRALAPDARLAVYRTAQEALTNVRRHAAAERVEVRLAYESEGTVLVIEDHARPGTPPPAALSITGNGNGYGLAGMRERAELLGGELLAEPTDDGFRVELRLPA